VKMNVSMKKINWMFCATALMMVLEIFCVSCNKEKEADYTINVGDSFSVVLDSNFSTGYGWQCENADELECVTLENHFYQQTEEGNGKLGIEVFIFIGEKKGREEVKLSYSRDFSEEIIDTRSFVVLVI